MPQMHCAGDQRESLLDGSCSNNAQPEYIQDIKRNVAFVYYDLDEVPKHSIKQTRNCSCVSQLDVNLSIGSSPSSQTDHRQLQMVTILIKGYLKQLCPLLNIETQGSWYSCLLWLVIRIAYQHSSSTCQFCLILDAQWVQNQGCDIHADTAQNTCPQPIRVMLSPMEHSL